MEEAYWRAPPLERDVYIPIQRGANAMVEYRHTKTVIKTNID
jgi:hypothetical protein